MIDKKKVFAFIFSGMGIFIVFVIIAGQQQGWFARSYYYRIQYDTGDGVFVGTPVSISGLKAGSVRKVELTDDNKIEVQIKIQEKFSDFIRQDSKAVLGRPFIIGERAIAITPGSRNTEKLHENEMILGEESLELTDLLSGGRLSPYFQTFSKLLDQIRLVIEGDGKGENKNLIQVYQQAYKTLKALEDVGYEVTKIRKDFIFSPDTQKIVKDLAESSDELAQVLIETQKTLPHITQISGDVVKLVPEITKTLHETVFTLQALQRSFILSGGVSSLKKENAEKEKQKTSSDQDKKPANE
jgi:phospholipid/cholesterol/gamma-HCH transport system substrate-binding protein